MKKLFTLFLALAASAGTMFASNTKVDGIWYDFDDNNLTAKVTYRGSAYDSYSNEYSGAVVIPASVTYNAQAYSVTSIRQSAFSGCTGLTSVTIGENITSIGGSAFSGCTGLTSVVIPNSVTSIGDWAFRNCTGLTSVTIGENITSIGDAFSGCTGLTSVVWNAKHCDDFRSGMKSPFYYRRSQITSFVFGDEVEHIPAFLCYGMSVLSNITIPNSVARIGNGAFFNCKGLTSVVIPNSVTNIGDSAFCYCEGLTSVTIGNSVTSIGGYAFSGCTGLTSVTIPNSVTSIGDYAFSTCRGLTSVTIGNSVTSIGKSAFSSCTGLTSVTIPNSVTSIGAYTFSNCTGLTSVTIGCNVTKFCGASFESSYNLTSFTCLAATPPSLGRNEFSDNENMQAYLYVPAESVNLYKESSEWLKYFKSRKILPISAKETETTTVKTEPTETSVEVTWPAVTGAYTYELVIRDKKGNVICTLIFNAKGQLQSIVFNAPSRDGAPQHKQEAGFSFVVTGLDSGTEYSYDIIAKDENGSVLDTKSGSFTTQAPQGIEDVLSDQVQSTKVVRNGQVLILRGEKTYTVTGQEVK